MAPAISICYQMSGMRKCPASGIAHRCTVQILNRPDRGPRSLGVSHAAGFHLGGLCWGAYKQTHRSENKAEPQDWPKPHTFKERLVFNNQSPTPGLCSPPLAIIRASAPTCCRVPGKAGSVNIDCIAYLPAKSCLLSL